MSVPLPRSTTKAACLTPVRTAWRRSRCTSDCLDTSSASSRRPNWPTMSERSPTGTGARRASRPRPPQVSRSVAAVFVTPEVVDGCRAWTRPLRCGTCRVPARVACGIRSPVPARPCSLGPAVGTVLPRLAPAVRRHVEQAEGPDAGLVPAARRVIGKEGAVAVAQEAGEASAAAVKRPLKAAGRVPRLCIAHERQIRLDLIPSPRGQDRERDPPRVEIGSVPQLPCGYGAAFALTLVWCAVMPHVLVDEKFLAALEQRDERNRSACSDDLDHPVELDHRQPPARPGDGVALARMRLLADQQIVARRLPGGHVDRRRSTDGCTALIDVRH